MRAALTALMIAGAAAPASAAFRYVPPANAGPGEVSSGEPRTVEPGAPETDRIETDAVGDDAGRVGADRRNRVEPAAAEAAPEPWRVHAGETLREVLARWGVRASVEVQFLTDRRYRLHGAGVFEGGFDGAVQALFKALDHLPHPPAGEFVAGGGSFAVTHRAPNLFDLENGP